MYEEWIAKIAQELKGLPDFPLGHPLVPHRETLGLQLQKEHTRWTISQYVNHPVQASLDAGVQGLSLCADSFVETDLSYIDWTLLTLRLIGGKEKHLRSLKDRAYKEILLEEGDFNLFHGTFGSALTWVIRENSSGLADVLLRAEEHALDKKRGKVLLLLEAKENFYENLARIRALKHLWRVLENTNETQGLARVGVLLPTVKTDPYLELIARTQMILSSATGGAEWMEGSLLPNMEGEMALRLDANLHHILHWESAVGEVDDPASGAYFLEHLTRSFIQNIWTKFLEDYEKSTGS
jgi:hypothetical protein